MPETAKLGLVLLLFCAVATALLGYVNAITVDRIALINEQNATADRQEILNNADDFEQIPVDGIAVSAGGRLTDAYIAKSGSETVGYAITTEADGFGGAVTVLTGFDTEGKIIDIKVTPSSETPGLGARSAEEEFSDDFEGAPSDAPLAVTKDGGSVDAITGATITSRAVVVAVNTAIEAYHSIEGGN